MAIKHSAEVIKAVVITLSSVELEKVKEGLYFDVLFDYDFKRPHIVSIHDLLAKIDEDTPEEVETLVRNLFAIHGNAYFAFVDQDYSFSF